jgi:hypothetical protein
MLFAVDQSYVVTTAQHRLYAPALATVACIVPGGGGQEHPCRGHARRKGENQKS